MTEPRVGDVWRFPYLWHREAKAGETEGRKDRPCALTLLRRIEAGHLEILLVPITSQPSDGHPFAVEIPETEKRRAGLAADLRLWVITDEWNVDTPSTSFYFEPSGRIGTFSAVFTKQVQRQMMAAIRARQARGVSRR